MARGLNEVKHLVEIFSVDGAVLVHITEALADIRNTISVDVINISVFDVTEVENSVAVAVRLVRVGQLTIVDAVGRAV